MFDLLQASLKTIIVGDSNSHQNHLAKNSMETSGKMLMDIKEKNNPIILNDSSMVRINSARKDIAVDIAKATINLTGIRGRSLVEGNSDDSPP